MLTCFAIRLLERFRESPDLSIGRPTVYVLQVLWAHRGTLLTVPLVTSQQEAQMGF